MKIYLYALTMCQSMFCAIPCPWRIWEEKARDKMLLFLPLVGLEIGLIWAAADWLAGVLGLPAALRALVLCLCPYVLTGFIHLDGFLDVTDAVGSCRDLQRRREILKDPHVGSFAVIGFGVLLLSQFACFFSCGKPLGILILVPVVSRCGSALAISLLKPMPGSQYASRGDSRGYVPVLAAILAAALALGFLIWGSRGFVLLGALAGYVLALRKGYKSFGGMNGDIAGYCLTLSELTAAAVCCFV